MTYFCHSNCKEEIDKGRLHACLCQYSNSARHHLKKVYAELSEARDLIEVIGEALQNEPALISKIEAWWANQNYPADS